MRIHGVGQVAIGVRDVDRAVKFYRDVLEIPFLFQVTGIPEMAFFDCGGTRLYIVKPEDPEAKPDASVIYFTVDSARDAAEELKSKGVELESEPRIIHQTASYTLWMAFFRDPDGNLMAAMSEEGDLMG
jgi:catechol 2,3-dioxygenase-like lactoylglutathione lyase family enzyme